MLSRVTLSMIAILSIIVASASTSNSDLSWPSEDNPLFSDTELSSNQGFLPLDQSKSLFDLAQVPGDSDAATSLSIFSDTNSDIFTSSETDTQGFNFIANDDDPLIPDDIFDLADCSTSQNFPAIGKSRLLRQRDGSRSCTNPATDPHTAADTLPGDDAPEPAKLDELNELLKDPDMLNLLTTAQSNIDHSTILPPDHRRALPVGGVLLRQGRRPRNIELPTGISHFGSIHPVRPDSLHTWYV